MYAEDLTAFFDVDNGFAVTASFSGGSSAACIFDADYNAGLVGVSGMAAVQPAITLPTASVPASPIGTGVTVNSVAYTIAEHQPDGTGISVLYLERA